ncbi:MAG: EFR1 family ferrodoxin [Erysipelotrichales bacterium]
MNTTAVYFSPTYTTKNLAQQVARGINPASEYIDIAKKEVEEHTFNQDDVVIFGVPTYGGRVPQLASENLIKFKGNNTKAVIIATYGNREYEDTLVELEDIVSAQGFIVVGAAAFIAQHTYYKEAGYGRPEIEDLQQASAFGNDIKNKIENNIVNDLNIKGNRPYKELSLASGRVLVNEKCIYCGSCAIQCPTDAIPKDAPDTTNLVDCIGCGRCISLCPTKARYFPEVFLEKIESFLIKTASGHKENEFFI